MNTNPIWDANSGNPTILSLPEIEREFSIVITPEDGAMMCALYSRSSESARVHAQGIQKSGSGKFMASYYSRYNHKSIADCGSTTVFSERVSIMAAKVIEDFPLFSGQETSTRYMDFSTAPIWEPTGHPLAVATIAKLMEMYHALREPLRAHLEKEHPRLEGEKESDWSAAIDARSFDIRRAWLPAGTATQVAWHGNLRQLADHLILMRHHPLEEVRVLANRIWAKLREEFPSSFPEDAAMLDVSGERAKGRVPEVEEYRKKVAKWTWGDFQAQGLEAQRGFAVLRDSISLDGISHDEHVLLTTRPRGVSLPAGFGEFGIVTFEAPLDYGSYRDLHRQRRGFWRMPLITPKIGFEQWYIDRLPPDWQPRAQSLVREVADAWLEVSAARGAVDSQNMLPMGELVPWRYTCGLPQVLYVAELRTPKTVHATARRIAQHVSRYVQGRWPWVAIHPDLEVDDWTVRRGTQTIVKKEPQPT